MQIIMAWLIIKGIPQVIEMTLINPKKFKIKKQKTTRNYPIQRFRL